MVAMLGFPYFWFTVLLLGGSAIARWAYVLTGGTEFSAWDALTSTLFLPILVPYYGVLSGTAFLVPPVWQLFTLYFIVESIRFYFLPKNREAYEKLGPAKSFVVFGLLTLISLPPLVAAVQYAFFSEHLFAP